MSNATVATIISADAVLNATDPTERAVLGFLARYREPTRTSYTIDLKDFWSWCTQHNVPMLRAGRLELELYIRTLQERGLAPATVARRFGTVAVFYKRAYRDELIDKNPADFVDRPPVDKNAQRRTWLNPLELSAVLKSARMSGPRDVALLGLMGMCGLRVGEVCSLNVEHFRVVDGAEVMHFIGKGRKAAAMVVPMQLIRPLHAVFGERDQGAVFLNREGLRMDRKAVDRVLQRHAKAAGIEHDITPHGLRRAFATAGRARGVELGELQQAMRHADPKTTTLYVQSAETLSVTATHTVAAFISGLSG